MDDEENRHRANTQCQAEEHQKHCGHDIGNIQAV